MIRSRRASWLWTVALAWMLTTAATTSVQAQNQPRQPLLGFNGELVNLPRDSFPADSQIRGMRVLSVNRGSPAARMGLERGDIIVNIDTWSFKSHAGYQAALRQASQRPSLILINVRNGKLTRRSCSLPHEVDENRHPDTVQIAIDLEEDMRR